MSDENAPAYAGFCQGCGHMVSAIVDRPEWKRDVARFCEDTVSDGLRLERVTVGRARVEMEFCACQPRHPVAVQEEIAL